MEVRLWIEPYQREEGRAEATRRAPRIRLLDPPIRGKAVPIQRGSEGNQPDVEIIPPAVPPSRLSQPMCEGTGTSPDIPFIFVVGVITGGALILALLFLILLV